MKLNQIFAKLKGIEKALSNYFEMNFNGRLTKFLPRESVELFDEYNTILKELKLALPDLYQEMQERQLLRKPQQGDEWVYYENYVVLIMDIQRIFEIKRVNEIALQIPSEHQDIALLKLDTIFTNFHKIAQELRDRYSNRPTILLNDEYDVQDLLRAVLRLHFKDIRPEDYSPSNSGSNSRIDFILKEEKIGIEVKMTNSKLSDKKLGEELLIDIGRYKEHPDCKVLLIFIYDKMDSVRNKAGLIRDLNSNSADEFTVITYINPN